MKMWVVVTAKYRKMIVLNYTKDISSESFDRLGLYMSTYLK